MAIEKTLSDNMIAINLISRRKDNEKYSTASEHLKVKIVTNQRKAQQQ
jgi:hypothetical protein